MPAGPTLLGGAGSCCSPGHVIRWRVTNLPRDIAPKLGSGGVQKDVRFPKPPSFRPGSPLSVPRGEESGSRPAPRDESPSRLLCVGAVSGGHGISSARHKFATEFPPNQGFLWACLRRTPAPSAQKRWRLRRHRGVGERGCEQREETRREEEGREETPESSKAESLVKVESRVAALLDSLSWGVEKSSNEKSSSGRPREARRPCPTHLRHHSKVSNVCRKDYRAESALSEAS